MRRFSQRSHLVTLSEINITPLLDLAFVLLIIFVITTPLLEQGLELKLPSGGLPDRRLTKNDFRTLEVGRGAERGTLLFEGRRLALAQLGAVLDREKQANPNIVIFIRADRTSQFQDVFEVTDECARRGLGVSFRAEPPDTR
jgi:biopolymer transport protein ExbD